MLCILTAEVPGEDKLNDDDGYSLSFTSVD